MRIVVGALVAGCLLTGFAEEVELGPQRAHAHGCGYTLEGGDFVIDNGTSSTNRSGVAWSFSHQESENFRNPFKVSVETLCEDGPGGMASLDYSIHIDLNYWDGGHIWGAKTCFAPEPGKSWQAGEVTVIPERAVKNFTIHLLYRSLPGRVRFRKAHLTIFEKDELVMFDAFAVRKENLPKSRKGFFVRDHAEGVVSFAGVAPGGVAKGVRLAVKETASKGGDVHYAVKAEDTTGKDRAVTLLYTLPLPARGALVYEQDPRHAIPVKDGDGQFSITHPFGCGAGGLNQWPFSAATVDGKGFALGIDMRRPAYFRTALHASRREMIIAFDIGFTPEKRTAEFGFRTFGFKGGFRGALATYATIERESFRSRVKEHGIWVPWVKIGSVPNWQDFGFRFKEGDGDMAWDDANGICTLTYTEPGTWWMGMDKIHGTKAFDMEDCRRAAEERAAQGNALARAWKCAPMITAEGKPFCNLADNGWCHGALWMLTTLPNLTNGEYWVKNAESAWAKRYAKPMPAGGDGEYIDSAEWWYPPLDFNRAAYSASETPLCFSTLDHRPALFVGLARYEYVRRTADRLRPLGRFVMCNGVPGDWPWMVGVTDIGGTESKWIDAQGKWKPWSHDALLKRRAMSIGKPYCFLLNVEFEKMSPELMERFMQYCLAYGMFPGCFSPNAAEGQYFTRPEIYERDRALFKKYVPLCKLLSEAGWRPGTRLVKSGDARVFVERFGGRYITVFNSDMKNPVKAVLTAAKGARAKELLSGEEWHFAKGDLEVVLPPESVRVLDFGEKR